MHSALPILALLGAGALAHPSLKHLRLHEKRDEVNTVTKGNEVYVEYLDEITVTVPYGGQTTPPATTTTAAVVVPENLAVNPVPVNNKQAKGRRPGSSLINFSQTPTSIIDFSVTPVPVKTSKTPVASPIQTTSAKPESESEPSASTSAAAAPSDTATTPVDGKAWAKSPLSPISGGSGAKDVLTQANYWREKWMGLPPFTWSSTLAQNAYKTATSPIETVTDPKTGKTSKKNQGGATEMNHALYEGSMGQCIAGGDNAKVTEDLTPFEHAFLMWICELPNANIPCDGGAGGETGHADIIKGEYSEIGCYYMDSTGDSGMTGMWTCDFAG